MDPRLVYIGDKKEAVLLTTIERHFKIKRVLLKIPKEWVKSFLSSRRLPSHPTFLLR